jgi:hypothetical protein
MWKSPQLQIRKFGRKEQRSDRAIQSQTSAWFSNANNITWNDVWNTQPKWRRKNPQI